MPPESSGRTWLLLALLAASVGSMAVLAADPATWTGFVAAAFCAGGLTAWLGRRGGVSIPLVIAAALLFRIAVFWLPPVLSDDAYRYVWDGVVQAEGLNPYLHVPADPELAHLHDEPVFDDLNSASYYSVYPPVSQIVFRIGAYFYDRGWEVSFFVIKALFALMEFGAVLILSRFLRPEQLLVYAWNPLVLIAGAGQGHGEGALALFLSFALYALRRNRGSWASAWIACAGWVKLYPFVLWPYLWRRFGPRSAAVGIVAAVVLALPYLHPDVLSNVRESLELYVRYFEFNAGPYYAVKEAFRLATGADWSKQIGPAFGAAFLLLLPVLYALDWKMRWTARRAMVVAVGAFFLLSTTIHPWYLVGILVLVAPAERVSWHWYWLSIWSIGTYLLYVDGPYWVWVVIGWVGWSGLAGYRYRRPCFDPLLRARARKKSELLAPFLEDCPSILDVGAGEGYVGRAVAEELGADVHLVDVLDLNRTDLPHTVYAGRTLPIATNAFDAAMLVYVLHHARDAEAVLQEAVRVTGKRIVILESTFAHPWEHPLLRWMDRLVNSVRSEGRMDRNLRFRTHEEWLETFKNLPVDVVAAKDLGGFVHHQSLFVLAPVPGITA